MLVFFLEAKWWLLCVETRNIIFLKNDILMKYNKIDNSMYGVLKRKYVT